MIARASDIAARIVLAVGLLFIAIALFGRPSWWLT